MNSHPVPQPAARRLHLCILLGLWVGLVPFLVLAQSAPATLEWKQKSQAREIENIVGQLEEKNTSSAYLLYVVVPLIGLLGVLTFLRRLFLN